MEYKVRVFASYQCNFGQKDYFRTVSVMNEEGLSLVHKTTNPGRFFADEYPYLVHEKRVRAKSPEEALVIYEKWANTGVKDKRVY